MQYCTCVLLAHMQAAYNGSVAIALLSSQYTRLMRAKKLKTAYTAVSGSIMYIQMYMYIYNLNRVYNIYGII